MDILLAHVANECEACKAASARSCSICQARDRIYPFQVPHNGGIIAIVLSSHPLNWSVMQPGGRGATTPEVFGMIIAYLWIHLLGCDICFSVCLYLPCLIPLSPRGLSLGFSLRNSASHHEWSIPYQRKVCQSSAVFSRPEANGPLRSACVPRCSY